MTDVLVRARLELSPPGAGGRSGAIESGYRSLVRFNGNDADFGVEIKLEVRTLSPGASGMAGLRVWAADTLQLAAGLRFEIREGARVVGTGEIIDVTESQ